MRALKVCCVLLSLFGASLATLGLDVSSGISESAFHCLKGKGFHFAIARCWHSTGTPDSNVVGTVSHAWAAGFAHVDVYMFPCHSCGNAANQVRNAVKYLRDHNVKFGMFWFDIEGPQYWGSVSSNVKFMEEALSEAKRQGVKVGIYTSASQWNPIMGNYHGGSAYPLWYAHYDGSASFSDFRPFGGWTHPSIKQFRGTTSACGVGIDENWYP